MVIFIYNIEYHVRVCDRLNSNLEQYIPSLCFSAQSILSPFGITKTLKYALDLISAAEKCFSWVQGMRSPN